MSQSSAPGEAVVRKFFELLNAEDLEGVRALLTEGGPYRNVELPPERR